MYVHERLIVRFIYGRGGFVSSRIYIYMPILTKSFHWNVSILHNVRIRPNGLQAQSASNI